MKIDPEDVRRLRLQRKGITEIARLLGVSKQDVAYHLQRLGLDTNEFEGRQPSSDFNDAMMERVKQLRQDGLSLRDIAQATGVPETTVRRLLKR